MGNILCTLQLFIAFHKYKNKNTNTQNPQMFYCNRNFKVKVRAFIKRNLLTLQRHIGNSLYRVTRICLKCVILEVPQSQSLQRKAAAVKT